MIHVLLLLRWWHKNYCFQACPDDISVLYEEMMMMMMMWIIFHICLLKTCSVYMLKWCCLCLSLCVSTCLMVMEVYTWTRRSSKPCGASHRSARGVKWLRVSVFLCVSVCLCDALMLFKCVVSRHHKHTTHNQDRTFTVSGNKCIHFTQIGSLKSWSINVNVVQDLYI